MDLGIAGRRAAVAAASRGLGLATAAALAAEGVDRRDLQPRPGADRRRRPRASVPSPLVADVSTARARAAFVRDARDALGGVDILVAQRGRAAAGRLRDVTDPAARTARRSSSTASSTIAMCNEAVPGDAGRSGGGGCSRSPRSRCASRSPT